MYDKSPPIYDELYHFKDYAAAAARLNELIQRLRPQAKSMLDVACGTGRHLEELQNHYNVEGTDISAGMLEVAQRRCPGVPLHQADMVDLNLGKKFDVVTCLFSSIAYTKQLARLQAAIARMANHVKPGGLLIIEPFFGPDNFWVHHVVLNRYEHADLKIAWMYVTEREGLIGRWYIHYLVGRPEGVEHFTELHEVGLFTPEEYVDAFRRAGVPEVILDPQGLFGRGMYIGTRL
jgi:ubiquinone/menaquinone biosynthesis C-methylase UbiE